MGLEITKALFGAQERVADVTDIVRAKIEADSFMFVGNHMGDPAPWQKKALQVEFTLNDKASLIVVPEGTIFIDPSLPRPTEEDGFKIVRAHFGIGDRWINVTEKVAAKIKDPFHPVGFKMEDFGEDPCPNYVKSLIIIFIHDKMTRATFFEEREWRPLLPKEAVTHFRARVNSMFHPLAGLQAEHAVKDLERVVIESGLSDCSLFNFPAEIQENCGKGLNIWQYPIQFAPYLAKVAKLVKPQSYLEIGIRFGGTFAFTTEYLKKFTGLKYATGVDLLESPFMLAYEQERLGVDFIMADSHKPESEEMIKKKDYDLVLVDGDHCYEGCMADVMMTSRFAKAVALHDICDQGFPNGVPKVWAELPEKLKGWSFFEFTEQYKDVSDKNGGKTYLGIGLAVKNQEQQ